MRWNLNTDTPWPPDEPRGENPPDGAIIDYALKAAAAGPVTLEILDGKGAVVRRYSSADPVEQPDPATAAVPLYWYRPLRALPATAGMHRVTWDFRYQPLPGGGGRGGLPIAAVPFNTVAPPNAPWAAPGQYTVKLTVDGKSYAQPLTLKLDPRVKAPALALATADRLAKALYDGVQDAQSALQEVRALRASVKEAKDRAEQAPVAGTLESFDRKLASVEGMSPGPGGRGAGRGGGAGGPDTLSSIGGTLTPLMSLLQGADAPATGPLVQAVAQRRDALAVLMAKWTAVKTVDLKAVNAELAKAGMTALVVK